MVNGSIINVALATPVFQSAGLGFVPDGTASERAPSTQENNTGTSSGRHPTEICTRGVGAILKATVELRDRNICLFER
ncbi:hypothetical protein PC116_g29285 [Phytophthora cactorum]|uniref:Uncharacterized protein n=1 Tax=Phytophthora cactorum TaxID=29920 RepID=A0A8T1JFM7_9STRA|nr:hypothetical protein PC114_g27104 [Phytophthora cactorum]KAG2877648.1 hypothetical protein PC117_g27048 [Phytophthora cactorum]KAG2958836.1 hypothetical protein PC119_g26895 [Phytophthora cactorum]KAG2967934.1 hypothetical protein PC120_g26889 [Phytophthora cactorum]KAG4036241.1 hypothetical protein PC123_g28190 [Phytophthora cactorum]